MWTVVYYVADNGTCLVERFLKGLDRATQIGFLASIDVLRNINLRAREPFVHHVEGKLWELPEMNNRRVYRLIYFLFSGQHIVFLHGFETKIHEVPPRYEIEIALECLMNFMNREGTKE